MILARFILILLAALDLYIGYHPGHTVEQAILVAAVAICCVMILIYDDWKDKK